MNEANKRIMLASQSPRRRQLLSDIGLEFSVMSPQTDEDAITAATPDELAAARALHKAQAGARILGDGTDDATACADALVSDAPAIGESIDAVGSSVIGEHRDGQRVIGARTKDTLVIGADTIVVCDGQVLGKPVDKADARRLLTMLSGRTHTVITGVAVCEIVVGRETAAGRCEVATAHTEVTFRPLLSAEIRRYVETGEPMDKAGAYGIQGKGALLVDRIVGDYFNVVGLPLTLLASLLHQFGRSLL